MRKLDPTIAVTVEDAPDPARFRSFYERCFAAEYGRARGTASPAATLRRIGDAGAAAILPSADDDARAVIASRDGIPLGTAVFAERGGYVYAWGLYVAPEHLRQGIGSRLMDRLCASTDPASVIELSVLHTSEAALRFYAALGFDRRASRTEKVFPDVPAPVFVMQCPNAVCRSRLQASGVEAR